MNSRKIPGRGASHSVINSSCPINVLVIHLPATVGRGERSRGSHAWNCADDNYSLRHRSFVGDGDIDARLASGWRNGLQPHERAACKVYGRTAWREVDHTHVAPEYSCAQAGAQGFCACLLRRKTLCIGLASPGPAVRGSPLRGSEDPAQKSLAMPLDRPLDPAHVDEIGSDAEDHRRPRSMAARIVLMALASPM